MGRTRTVLRSVVFIITDCRSFHTTLTFFVFRFDTYLFDRLPLSLQLCVQKISFWSRAINELTFPTIDTNLKLQLGCVLWERDFFFATSKHVLLESCAQTVNSMRLGANSIHQLQDNCAQGHGTEERDAQTQRTEHPASSGKTNVPISKQSKPVTEQ